MKELKKTRRLTIASILFVIIIVIGFLTLRKPEYTYKLSTQEMVEQLYNIDTEMLPDEAMEIISYGDSLSVFVDLRNPYEYQKGFLGEAINIPVSDILLEESIEFFDAMQADSITVILYANTQLDANGSWMLLQQIGYSNVKILLGGYNYLTDENIDYYDMPDIPEYFVEEPAIIFSEVISNMSSQNFEQTETENKPQNIQPIKRKKKAVAEGGC
jgi:rhodanese-related sulfurtransferase